MRKPLHRDGLKLLLLYIGELSTRVWFGISLHHAKDILLGTSSIDRCISEIFPAKRKVVSLEYLNSPNSSALAPDRKRQRGQFTHYGNK